MAAAEFRIFLSAVTSEFGRARDALAADLRSRGLLVRVQSDFRQEAQAPVNASRAARAVGLRPEDDLGLFGPGGRVAHPERLRAVLDAVVSQEIGPPHCPQPPRGEAWLGCRVEDGLFRRALELLDRPG